MGPVVAAAVILPDAVKGRWKSRVRDSKQIKPAERETLYAYIKESAVSVGTGASSHEVIDKVGIARATRLAMIDAIQQLQPEPHYILIDYFKLPETPLPNRGVPDGDNICFSIACASIIAKVTRDRLVIKMANDFPEYGFDSHKGYGTRRHLECLRRNGPCPLHRKSFRPVSEMVGQLL